MPEAEAGNRCIIHVDMDAFFASVEQRDNPYLKGVPVIVGGDPDGRGVVSACSYEARRYGIRSAMATSSAYRLCPHGVFLHPRFEAYREASNRIMGIFYLFTDMVEPISLDEAYLDVTVNKLGIDDPEKLAVLIRKRIKKDTGLTASAGISYNKFLAKIASDQNKPDGQFSVPREEALDFLSDLPIGRFFGIGKVTGSKMERLGISKGSDLRRMSRSALIGNFGRMGEYYHDIVRGIDNRPVTGHRKRRSIGSERTFHEDIDDVPLMLARLGEIAKRLERELRRRDLTGRTITLRMKYFDFQRTSRCITVPQGVEDSRVIMDHISKLLPELYDRRRKVRLLGISMSNLIKDGGGSKQASLSLWT